MLDPELPDARRDEIVVETRRRIEGAGELKQERSWGMRKLAYEIKQRTEADYRFFRFGRGDGLLEDLDHNLKITDGVLRFRIFKVEPDAPVIDPPPPVPLTSTTARGGAKARREEERRPAESKDGEASQDQGAQQAAASSQASEGSGESAGEAS